MTEGYDEGDGEAGSAMMRRGAMMKTAMGASVRSAVILVVGLGVAVAGWGQTAAPQRVYGSTTLVTPPTAVVGLSKDGATGVLTPIAGSPFAERAEGGRIAIDGLGKFLFVANFASNDISMFAIDASSGALTEVAGSPFMTPSITAPGDPGPMQPLSIATERTGKFLFVGYRVPSAIVTLLIDTSGASPVLTLANTAVPIIDATPQRLLTDAKGVHLYVGEALTTQGAARAGALAYAIGTDGGLTLQGSATEPTAGLDYAIDPKDRFFYLYAGIAVPLIYSCAISPVDGTPGNCASSGIAVHAEAYEIQIENSGQYMYVATLSGDLAIYAIDQTTGVPTLVDTLTGFMATQANLTADPLGPYLYTTDAAGSANAIHTYQVNTASGNVTEIAGSPVSMGAVACCQSLAISGVLPVPVNGPGATISPSVAANFTATVGAGSAAQVFSIVNNGNQTLAISGISLAGAGAASFAETNTCAATLAVNANCTVSVTFNPASATTFMASLQVADNASGSPQMVALSGTGVAAMPAVTFTPSSLTFPGTAQGATALPMAVAVTNTGTGTLHISTVAVGGANAGDFAQTTTCAGAVLAVGASCSVAVTFTPVATGGRTATLTISDDAAGGSQVVALSGTGTAAFQLGGSGGGGGGTSATVTAGQTAQYALQLSPGAGFAGMVALGCSGAPVAATCTVMPATVNVTTASATAFTVSVTTTGAAGMAPVDERRFVNWRWFAAAAWAMLMIILLERRNKFLGRRLVYCAGVAAVSVFVVAGCGGGTTTKPVVTPAGSYTIVVTATAKNVPAQMISLALTVK